MHQLLQIPLQKHIKSLKFHYQEDLILGPFFVAFLRCLGAYQNKILFLCLRSQHLPIAHLFFSRISQIWHKLEFHLLNCCFIIFIAILCYYSASLVGQLCYHPWYKRMELLYVSHFRCKVGQSSSNRSTFLSINRIRDCLGNEPSLVCPPIHTLL